MTDQLALYVQGREPDYWAALPWPPSTNRYQSQWATPPRLEVILTRLRTKGEAGFWQWLRKATRVGGELTGEAKQYREHAGWKARASARGRFLGDARVACWMIVHPPTRRAIDIDNRVKQVLDVLELAGVIDDDRQVVDLRVTLGDVAAGGGVDVRLWRI